MSLQDSNNTLSENDLLPIFEKVELPEAAADA